MRTNVRTREDGAVLWTVPGKRWGRKALARRQMKVMAAPRAEAVPQVPSRDGGAKRSRRPGLVNPTPTDAPAGRESGERAKHAAATAPAGQAE